MAIKCADCGFVYDNENSGNLCPKCGSANRMIFTSDEAKGHELIKKGEKASAPNKHKHKFDYERVKGEKTGKDGELVNIDRIIDRERDYYKEVIKKDGKTMTEKEEKLSQHRKHTNDQLHVTCYSGRTYAERPKSFVWEGTEHRVKEVEKEWLEPGERHFRVRTEDDRLFVLHYNEQGDDWSAIEIVEDV